MHLGSPFATPLADKSTSTLFYVYVDNLGVIGVDGDEVGATMGDIKHTFESKNLKLHEEEMHSGSAEVLRTASINSGESPPQTPGWASNPEPSCVPAVLTQ